jgi:hypothetical protein
MLAAPASPMPHGFVGTATKQAQHRTRGVTGTFVELGERELNRRCFMRTLVATLAAFLPFGIAGSASAEDETKAEPHTIWSEVHFEFDSSLLSESARARLDEAAAWLTSNDTGVVLIEGHADRVGDEPYNRRLAERRALAAKQYLVERGTRAEQIQIISYGEGMPAIDTAEPERANRRVVMIGLQKEPIVVTRTKTKTQRVEVPVEKTVYVPVETPAKARPYGMQLMAGGGVTGFVADYTNDVAGVGGQWTARFVGGTKRWIGFEAAYVGTAQDIDVRGGASNAALVGHGLEGNLRVNVIRSGWLQPYLFAGVGWANYDLQNVDTTTASMRESDNVVVVPAGAGINFRLSGDLVLDVRGTMRGAAADTMFDMASPTSNGLDSWSATAQVGTSF